MAGTTKSSAISARASTTTASTAPAARARLAHDVEVAALADVQRHGDHLDAELLLEPAHRHRGVEAAAVGQHDSLRHHCAPFSSVPSRLPCRRSLHRAVGRAVGAGRVVVPSCRPARRAARRPARRRQSSAATTRTVSSPATVPITPSKPLRSRAEPTTWARSGRGAQDDEVGRVRHLDHPLPQHPPEMVLGRDLVHGQLGQGVDGLTAGDPHLDGADLLEVARHRGLGGLDPFAGQELHQLRLVGHGVGLEQPGDAVLTLGLARSSPVHHPPPGPSSQASRPRTACMRLAAWRHTTLRGPSRTSAVISSPRWAGRQCRTTASGAAHAHHVLVDGEARRRPCAGAPAPPPGPSTSTRRCRARRPRPPPPSGPTVTSTSPPEPGHAGQVVGVGLVALGRCRAEPDARHGRRQGQRPPHVVGVADVGDGATLHVPEHLAQGQQVGQRLAGMGPVRQQVDHRHRRRAPSPSPPSPSAAPTARPRAVDGAAMRTSVVWSSTRAHITAW